MTAWNAQPPSVFHCGLQLLFWVGEGPRDGRRAYTQPSELVSASRYLFVKQLNAPSNADYDWRASIFPRGSIKMAVTPTKECPLRCWN